MNFSPVLEIMVEKTTSYNPITSLILVCTKLFQRYTVVSTHPAVFDLEYRIYADEKTHFDIIVL